MSRKSLTDGLLPDAPDPTLGLDTTRPVPAPPPGDQVTVYLTNAIRTSQGPGPGPKTLPAAEAGSQQLTKEARR